MENESSRLTSFGPRMDHILDPGKTRQSAVLIYNLNNLYSPKFPVIFGSFLFFPLPDEAIMGYDQ